MHTTTDDSPVAATSAPSSGRLPRLEGARALAAFMVMLTHAGFLAGVTNTGTFATFLARCDWGVALFFVLSGFLLSRPWARAGNSPSLRRYARHRAARILPAYWICLLAVLLVSSASIPARVAAENAALLQVYTGNLLPDLAQTWSLCTEAAFYLVLPLLAPWVFRSGLRTAAIRCAILSIVGWVYVAVCLGLVGGSAGALARLWLPGHLDWFAVGMLLAAAEPLLRRPQPNSPDEVAPTAVLRALAFARAHPGTVVLAAVTTFLLAMTPLGGPNGLEDPAPWTALAKEILYAVTAGLLMVAMLVPAAATQWWGRVLDSPGLRWAGRISYAFFLWQILILELVREALQLGLFEGGFWLSLAFATVVTAGVSELSWWLVERPALKFVGASTT